jgi:hypothetical protein
LFLRGVSRLFIDHGNGIHLLILVQVCGRKASKAFPVGLGFVPCLGAWYL